MDRRTEIFDVVDNVNNNYDDNDENDHSNNEIGKKNKKNYDNNKDKTLRESKGSTGVNDSSSDDNREHNVIRMALFKHKSHSIVLNNVRMAAIKKSKLVESQKAARSNASNDADGKTEAERLKEDRYQRKLASNRATAKRARLRRDAYTYELEKTLETLECQIKKLNGKVSNLERDLCHNRFAFIQNENKTDKPSL